MQREKEAVFILPPIGVFHTDMDISSSGSASEGEAYSSASREEISYFSVMTGFCPRVNSHA
jgi:hypothetical protein